MRSESEPVTNQYAMDPEVKKLWVEALRSGDYRQTRGALRKRTAVQSDGFCCLGVLCDLAEQAGVTELVHEPGGELSYGGAGAFLPMEVREWAGVGREGHFGVNHSERLIDLNDEQGKTFVEIADVIEKRL